MTTAFTANRATRELFCLAVLSLTTLIVSGCGSSSATGGTRGTLRIDGLVLSEIQLTVHRMDGNSTEPIGFGLTMADGTFELLQPGAVGPLWLAPGEYRITLESIGPPIAIPREYTLAETTPLKASWTANDDVLKLEAATAKRG